MTSDEDPVGHKAVADLAPAGPARVDPGFVSADSFPAVFAPDADGRHFADYVDRDLAQGEIHARPILPVSAPARIRRVAFLLDPEPHVAATARQRLEAFWANIGIALPMPGARRIGFTAGSRQVSWEFHTEFYTATWIAPFDDWEAWPAGFGLEVAGTERVIVAVRLDVTASAEITAGALAGFDKLSLCYSDIEGGRAQVATDFLVDRVGFTRYELAAATTGPFLLGSIVRRILEIETYRVMALIGIGLARSVSTELSKLEAKLNKALQEIGPADAAADSHALLETMHDLQVAAAHTVEQTRYRFSASQAYGDVLRQRLINLDEHATGEHRTLQRYLNHRVDPALATFKALEQRQAALFDQMARSTALLGTRISLDIQTQNRRILETISDTAQSQYRLQGTVEGLSAIAISYYLLGIIGYALHVFDKSYEHEKAIVIALLAPLILGVIWLRMRRMQK